MCGKAMKQRRIGDESRLKTILAAVHSMIQLAAAVFLWTVSAMEYRLNLYCERESVLALTALLTALSAGMVFVKGKLGKLGTTLAVFMPFADAACMFSMMLLYEPTGLICGVDDGVYICSVYKMRAGQEIENRRGVCGSGAAAGWHLLFSSIDASGCGAAHG